MKKRLLPLLLALCMALSLLPAAALADSDKVISSIDIVLKNPPEAGKEADKPDFDPPAGFTFTGWRWEDSYGEYFNHNDFQPGETYALRLYLYLSDGYSLVENNPKKVSAAINGIPAATGVSSDGTDIWIQCTFPKLSGEAAVIEDTVISRIDLTDVYEPRVGDEITFYSYTCPEGLVRYAYGWEDDLGGMISSLEGTSFEAGRTYTMLHSLKTEPHYVFATDAAGDPAVTVTINGKPAAAVDIYAISHNRYVIDFSYTFPPLPRNVIGSVSASVTAPAPGGTPAAPTISTANSTLKDYSWSPAGTFEAGQTYRLTIRADRSDSDNQYTDHTAVLINGRDAAISAVSEESITFYYDFTVATPTVSRIDAAIAAPVAGESPSFTAATDADSYTLSNVRWWELDSDREWVADVTESDTFKPNTYYEVWIDATPGDGYAFSGSASGYINGEKGGAAAKLVGSPVKEVYMTFRTGEIPVVKTLSSIAVTIPPDKTEYTAGDSLDTAGMVVTATYSDNSTAVVTDCTVALGGALTENDKTITVSYTEENVTKTATFNIVVNPVQQQPPQQQEPEPQQQDQPQEQKLTNPFDDVPDSQDNYYYVPILWAYYHEPQITTGTSATTFSLWRTCDRGQVVTFLWRSYGCPAPKSAENPFTDLTQDWYRTAVQWAVEQGITNGTSATTFTPDKTCSVAEVITFLWRAAGKPGESGGAGSTWYTDAMNWATGIGLLQGTTYDGTDPLVDCPRADIVTYLYRQFEQ